MDNDNGHVACDIVHCHCALSLTRTMCRSVVIAAVHEEGFGFLAEDLEAPAAVEAHGGGVLGGDLKLDLAQAGHGGGPAQDLVEQEAAALPCPASRDAQRRPKGGPCAAP